MSSPKIGDIVRRLRTDGPYGPFLQVFAVDDHTPMDGTRRKDQICMFDDDSWEFSWNLVIVGHPLYDQIKEAR